MKESKVLVPEELYWDKLGYICCSPLHKPRHDSTETSDPKQPVKGERGNDSRNSVPKPSSHNKINQSKANLGPGPNTHSPVRSSQVSANKRHDQRDFPANASKIKGQNRNCRIGGAQPWTESELKDLFRSV